MSEPLFFASQAHWRAWLQQHHADTREVTLGFYKKASGKGGITPDQALDEALCFGWIDGVRHSAGPDAFTNRYTPRTKRSYWSAVNMRKFEALKAAGRVHPAGQATFDARDPERNRFYSNENGDAAFPAGYEDRIRENEAAWEFWKRQPPSYRRIATHWVMSAKQETTRERRLATLIDDSANGRRIALVRPRNG